MSYTDPFTQVERKLWDLISAHPGVTSLVRAGNIKDDQDLGDRAQKEGKLGADLPELRILPAGGSLLGHSSTSIRYSQPFELQLLTGSERAFRQMYPVKWQLLRAFALTRRDPQWATLGLDFVIDVRISGSTDREDGVQADNNKPSWLSLLRIEVDMSLSQTALENQDAPTL